MELAAYCVVLVTCVVLVVLVIGAAVADRRRERTRRLVDLDGRLEPYDDVTFIPVWLDPDAPSVEDQARA